MTRRELLETLVLANEFKEGDEALGGTRDERLRADAREALGAIRLGRLSPRSLLDDGVSEAIAASLDPSLASEMAELTVGALKRELVSPAAVRFVERCRAGLSSEAIAAVVKLMSAGELSRLARAVFHPLPGDGVAIGSSTHLGSRIQPNSPGDDEDEVLFSILEGLAYGCGDVILGINPACDDLDTIVRLEELLARVVERLELPTRFCVLSDIVKQTSARARTRVDVGFQSLAGTSKALAGMVGLDARGVAELASGFDGLYFETGQGSEITNGAAEGIDMVTLESRTYGLARAIGKGLGGRWTIVNDVAGFIGPEVFASAAQLERACLEDIVMAKLHGLTMGLDVCSTFHMGIEPAELRRLTETIAMRAAPAYLMAVAGNADPMLGYLTTSYREHPRLRRQTGRELATPMARRLAALAGARPDADSGRRSARLYAAYAKAGGERRGAAALEEEAARRIGALRERGFDLGYGEGPDAEHAEDPPAATARLEAIYAHARRALYASLDRGVVATACARPLRVRTRARDRDDFLAHPTSGERLRDEDAARVAALHPVERPAIQLVVSDGLNADAVNENLRALMPPLRRGLQSIGRPVGDRDVVVDNGRVRVGYHVGGLVDADVVVHLIGERPGTGIDTLSAYVTYGRDRHGDSRWSVDLDHSATTAICGIHDRAKPPETAASEIARSVARMLERRASGVSLG